MVTKKEKIIARALEILKDNPSGNRYSELVRKIQEENPEIPLNTIRNTIVGPLRKRPDIYQPDRGFFRIKNIPISKQKIMITESTKKVKEEDFYKSFADWLVNEVEECTKAISLGGTKFKEKWGTPDVIGIREPRKSDIIKPGTEVVSAEIKIDTGALITAFGQACSYKLFSHKSYIVIPKESDEEDIARLDALGRIFGIGLILIDISNPKYPQFEIRVRAAKHEPDMFYVNKYMKIVEDNLFS